MQGTDNLNLDTQTIAEKGPYKEEGSDMDVGPKKKGNQMGLMKRLQILIPKDEANRSSVSLVAYREREMAMGL